MKSLEKDVLFANPVGPDVISCFSEIHKWDRDYCLLTLLETKKPQLQQIVFVVELDRTMCA